MKPPPSPTTCDPSPEDAPASLMAPPPPLWRPAPGSGVHELRGEGVRLPSGPQHEGCDAVRLRPDHRGVANTPPREPHGTTGPTDWTPEQMKAMFSWRSGGARVAGLHGQKLRERYKVVVPKHLKKY